MNLYFIVIICVICFFCLLALINAMQIRYENRKSIEALAKLITSGNGESGMSIDQIIAAISKKK